MAAGSTESFASASQTLGCFNASLLKQEKFWTAELMATASTGSFWEDDPEEATKKRVNELKRKFHSGRQLQIKHLPRDVTEEVSVHICLCVSGTLEVLTAGAFKWKVKTRRILCLFTSVI
jgi:hypothetical protein